MKGIILAGGSGTRLYPLTLGVSKQLLPVYDKPMIYYPLSVLMLAGIRDILIISTPLDLPFSGGCWATARTWGFVHLRGTAAARGPGPGVRHRPGIHRNRHGVPDPGRQHLLRPGPSEDPARAVKLTRGGLIFGYPVRDPERYGVVEFDAKRRVISIEEKPKKPKSNYAVPGLYFSDNDVVEYRREAQDPPPGARLEITDVNLAYLRRGELRVEPLGRGFAWLDTGTHEALQQAASFVQTIQERQGLRSRASRR